jgi:pimeloyl-ACP methyl ester carboxylesterase
MQTNHSGPIRPPSLLLALTEGHRALYELSSLAAATPLLRMAPRGDGHPVLVLPGFVTSDRSTGILRRYLRDLDYAAFAWRLGRNLGPRAIGGNGERLIERLEEIHAESERKVSLVGWSLGGVMARELAKRRPGMVRQVITLGSPFTGNPRASNVSRLYEELTGDRIDSDALQQRLAESHKPPPVPSTSIFTRTDGVVSWRNCIEPAAPNTDNVEVYGSHCGLGVNPAVFHVLADRLAQPEDQWAPFDRRGWRAAVYPFSGHLH